MLLETLKSDYIISEIIFFFQKEVQSHCKYFVMDGLFNNSLFGDFIASEYCCTFYTPVFLGCNNRFVILSC